MNRCVGNSLVIAILLFSVTGCSTNRDKKRHDEDADTPVMMDQPHQELLSGVLCSIDGVDIKLDPSGVESASEGLNKCIAAAAPSAVLALLPGIYRITAPILVDRDDLTITTAGLLGTTETCPPFAATCAVLKGDPALETLTQPASIMKIGYGASGANKITIDHIVFDGNADVRLADDARVAAACADGGGRNLLEGGGNNNVLQFSASVHTLCGTSAGWAIVRTGHESRIISNYFGKNGLDFRSRLYRWSDGLTTGTVSHSTIQDNTFCDNTDVDLIMGGAVDDTKVTNNKFVHDERYSFVAFMLTNWTSLQSPQAMNWADFRGLDFSYNTINCGSLCDISLQLGVLTWVYNPTYWGNVRVIGGNIHHNQISSQKQGINLAAAGSPDFPITIQQNTINVTASASTSMFSASTSDHTVRRRTGKLNIFAPQAENFADLDAMQEADRDMADAWHGLY